MSGTNQKAEVAVVIPCYRVAEHILEVVNSIPDCVARIYCVNDACPENSTHIVEDKFRDDPRVSVIKRQKNGGVGAAMLTGYLKAVECGAEIIVKLDGDGQMDPALIPLFVAEIAEGRADYVKGNRFYSLDNARSMPFVRKVGNMGLSFMTKLSTGYWQLFDPTNGYTAIHANLVRALPIDKIERRYFFESDMLFHVGLLHGCVVDVPMQAVYGDEESNLSDLDALVSFPLKHIRNFVKRIFFEYFLRNFSVASLELVVGFVLLLFGMVFGIDAWIETANTGRPATAGTVMLASLPSLLGIQFILNFFAYDMAREPKRTVHQRLRLLENVNRPDL